MPSQPTRLMGELHGVPGLPPHYLSRAEDLAELKQKLLGADGNIGITGQTSTVGVQGMGGIGKTVLATALAHDPEVRKVFPDGIFWLTVGQKPNLLLLQGKLLRQLTGVQPTFVTTEEGKDALRKAFEGRRVLVMLDQPDSGRRLPRPWSNDSVMEGECQTENHRRPPPAASLSRSQSFNSDGPHTLLIPMPTCPIGSDDVHCSLRRRAAGKEMKGK
jgi:NB-ARC domain